MTGSPTWLWIGIATDAVGSRLRPGLRHGSRTPPAARVAPVERHDDRKRTPPTAIRTPAPSLAAARARRAAEARAPPRRAGPAARLGASRRGWRWRTSTPFRRGEPRARDAVSSTNERFFPAHEAWETCWKQSKTTPDEEFFKGLSQLGAGYTHYLRGNPHGTFTLLRRGGSRVARYASPHLDVDTAGLSTDGAGAGRPRSNARIAPASRCRDLTVSR